MPNEKYDYLEGLDEELLEFLNDDYREMKKKDYEYYRYNRSLENMGEELLYKLSKNNLIQFEVTDKEKDNIKNIYLEKFNLSIRCLTKKQKRALDLYYICGYKQQQIADIMRIARGSVAGLISRAKDKIKEELKK